MNKLTSYILVGLTLCATLCASCTESGNTYSQGIDNYACDASFKPIIEEQRELFSARYPEAKLDTIYTNESDAMKMLANKETFVVITSRSFKQDEREYLEANRLIPKAFIIAYDGLALIQNIHNTDSCISVDNIKKILSGEVKDWNEINPKSTLGKIDIVFDNPKSSTVHFAEDSILGGKPICSENAQAKNNPQDVIKYVEKNKAAIGIIGSNWLNDKRDTTNITFRKDIRTMRVSRAQNALPSNSYLPLQVYLYTDEYPLCRTIYALTSVPKKGVATTFKNFLMSQNQGQLVFLKAGLLPAYGNITVREVHAK